MRRSTGPNRRVKGSGSEMNGGGRSTRGKRRRLYVGLDLGTSSLKGVVLDAERSAVAEVRRAYETARPGAGRAEQDPLDWTAAARSALAALAAATAAAGLGRHRAVGNDPDACDGGCGDAPGGPGLHLGGLPGARRSRGDRFTGRRDRPVPADRPAAGRALPPAHVRVDPPQRPGAGGAHRLVLGAKDYLFSWLTGQIATDPSTASGYGGYDLVRGTWMRDVAALAGAAATGGGPGRPGLPPVVPSTATWPLEPSLALVTRAARRAARSRRRGRLGARRSRPSAPWPRAPWPTCGARAPSSSAPATQLMVDPERRCLITPLAVGGWGTEMDLVSTGAAVAWLSRILGFGESGQAQVFAAAAEAADGLVPAALPFVGVGEQGALWDNDVRGTFVGLDLSHGPGDLARAMLDGIILESHRCLARLRELGLPQGDVRVAWRGADPWFCQRLADVSSRTVIAGDPATSSSAAGAARLAAIADGRGAAGRGSRRPALHDPTARQAARGTAAGASTNASSPRCARSTARGRREARDGREPDQAAQ